MTYTTIEMFIQNLSKLSPLYGQYGSKGALFWTGLDIHA